MPTFSDYVGDANAKQLQDLFDSNGIPIDLSTNKGLGTLMYNRLRFGMGVSFTDLNNEETTGREFAEFIHDLYDDGRQSNLFVFKPGDEYPRMILYDEKTDSFMLTPPFDQVKQPVAPGLFASFLRIFGIGEERFKEYEIQNRMYFYARRFMGEKEFVDLVESRKDNPSRLYDSEIAAANRNRERGDEMSAALDAENAYRDVLNEVKDNMTAAFGNWEANSEAYNVFDYITIEGQSLHALLFDEFMAKADLRGINSPSNLTDPFLAYCKTVLPQRAYEAIAAAMVDGKHVHVYPVDDKTGALKSDKPESWKLKTPLKTEGVDAALLKNIHDRYKIDHKEPSASELFASLNTYSENIKKINAFDTVRNVAKKHDKFFTEWENRTGLKVKELNKRAGHLNMSVTRSGLQSHVLGYLAAKTDIPVEEIFDPSKHKELKAQVGAEIADHYLKNDADWLAEINVEGQMKLGKAVSNALDGVNYANSKELFQPKNGWIFFAAHTAFDLNQELAHVRQQGHEYLKRTYGEDKLQEMINTVDDLGTGFCATLSGIADSNVALAHGMIGHHDKYDEAVPTIVTNKIIQGDLDKEMKANPGKKIHEVIDFDKNQKYLVATNITASDTQLGKAILGSGNLQTIMNTRKDVAKFANADGFQKNFDLNIDLEHGKFEATAKTDAFKVQEASEMRNAMKQPSEVQNGGIQAG